MRMKQGVRLFFIFSKIGLFTLGGGYAMLPLMERELVGPYLSRQDFLDVTAVAQSAPGIMAINVSILTGYRLQGVPGAVAAACGAALPSCVIILAIALFFRKFAENPATTHSDLFSVLYLPSLTPKNGRPFCGGPHRRKTLRPPNITSFWRIKVYV